MNIYAIDPGVTTGFVMVGAYLHVDYVKLIVASHGAETNPSTVATLPKGSRCRIVVMEQKPSNPSAAGLDNWEHIYHRLMSQGFQVAHNGKIDQHRGKTIFFVQPSSWKPFMKSRKHLLPSDLRKHHTADAARMLHYFVQFNYPNKEIDYA